MAVPAASLVGLSHGFWCLASSILDSSASGSSFRGFSRPGPSYPSVSPSGGFTHSSPEVEFSGAEITVLCRDGDGHSNAVGTDLGCPSPAEPGLGTSSLNGSGGSPPGTDRIDASWEILWSSSQTAVVSVPAGNSWQLLPRRRCLLWHLRGNPRWFQLQRLASP